MSKDYKKLIFVAMSILILAFYWSEIRPMMARKTCQGIARNSGAMYFNYDFLKNETALRKSQLQEVHMGLAYERCLHDKGIAE